MMRKRLKHFLKISVINGVDNSSAIECDCLLSVSVEITCYFIKKVDSITKQEFDFFGIYLSCKTHEMWSYEIESLFYFLFPIKIYTLDNRRNRPNRII